MLFDWARGKKARSGAVSLDNVVQISCIPSQLPTVVPRDNFWELKLYHSEAIEGGSFVFSTASPGAPMHVFTDFPTQAFLCRVSNLSTASVLNANALIAVNFRSGPMASDEVIYSRAISMPSMNLSGSPGIFEFYARNYSREYYVEVTLPATASGQIAGSDQRQTFKLATGVLSGFILPPFKREGSS